MKVSDASCHIIRAGRVANRWTRVLRGGAAGAARRAVALAPASALGPAERVGGAADARAVAAIGRPTTVAGLFTHTRSARWLSALIYLLAWVLLVVGIAGPRWGNSDEPGVAVGRDVVIVIDLSRTMLAEDMSDPAHKSRWEAARAGALDLLDAMERRGGHRVGVVLFAARPKVACPLTTDYAHVRAILEDIDGKYPPPECRPGADPNITSGTRIGSALVAAVETHDVRFTGSQDIILITDGDDPESDKEWIRGANAARAANIPVYTVGVGSATKPTVLELGEELVSTQLQEVPLTQMQPIRSAIMSRHAPTRRNWVNSFATASSQTRRASSWAKIKCLSRRTLCVFPRPVTDAVSRGRASWKRQKVKMKT